jgi:hypothetical protein
VATNSRKDDDDWSRSSGAFGRDWSLPSDKTAGSPRKRRGDWLLTAGLFALFLMIAAVGFSLAHNTVW